MSHKYKLGDIIRIADEKDQAYSQNNFYEVIELTNKGYSIRSLSHGVIHSFDKLDLLMRLENFNINNRKTVQELLELDYRLATEAEKVLYVKK